MSNQQAPERCQKNGTFTKPLPMNRVCGIGYWLLFSFICCFFIPAHVKAQNPKQKQRIQQKNEERHVLPQTQRPNYRPNQRPAFRPNQTSHTGHTEHSGQHNSWPSHSHNSNHSGAHFSLYFPRQGYSNYSYSQRTYGRPTIYNNYYSSNYGIYRYAPSCYYPRNNYGPVIYPPLFVDAYGVPIGGYLLNNNAYGYNTYRQPYASATRARNILLQRPEKEPSAAVVRARNEARTLRLRANARSLISRGDIHFRLKKYTTANRRYREAASVDTTFADPWFRRGMAEIAMGRYAEAAAMIRRGLALDPNWPNSRFQLRNVYVDAATIRQNQESLAKAAIANPASGDELLLLGVMLHFNGERNRAAPFFKKAILLDKENDVANLFLPQDVKRQAEAQRPQAPQVHEF